MASTLLNAVIRASIYSINSNPQVDRSVYPYGMDMVFGTGSVIVQPNTGSTINELEAGRTRGAALVYTRIISASNPGTVWHSNLTVANIITNLAT